MMTDEALPLEKPTILVVDDTPENLSMMSFLLKDLYKVKVANQGQKALRIAASEPRPDLILLDIMMPEMDGYEVCRQLQQDPQTRNIPIIFLTAGSAVIQRIDRHGIGVGACGLFDKRDICRLVCGCGLLARTHIDIQVAGSAHGHLCGHASVLYGKPAGDDMEHG